MGPQHLRPSNSSWLKDSGYAQAVPEQQQQQQQRDFLQRPTASKAPPGGALMRQLEVLPAMKRSASADSLAPVPHDDVRSPSGSRREDFTRYTSLVATCALSAYS